MDCKRRSSNSAETIGGNDDLLTEFLTLIPAKQVTRLKLVSKQWNSLISTPTFSHRHTLRYHHPKPPPQAPSFLLNLVSSDLSPSVYYHYQPPLNKLNLFRFSIPFPFIRIMQCCSGLLLLEAKSKPYGRNDYFVCNPTTMQFRDLLIGSSSVSQQICLVFDPLKSSHYKVIRFTAKGQPRAGREYTIDVYESETHSWKNNLGKHRSNNWQFSTGVYWNGGMYFIRPDGNSYCFHLQDDEIGGEGRMGEQVIDRPPRVPGKAGRRSIYMVESNGHLHSMSLSLQTRNKYVYVYELNKEDHSWFEKFRVDLNPIAHVFVDKYPAGQGGIVFGFVRGEREEDSSFVLHQPGKVMLYRLNNRKSLEVLVDYTSDDFYTENIYRPNRFRCNDYYEFIETLAPV